MLRVIGDLVSTLFEDLREEHLSVYLICHFDHIACVTDQSHTAEDVVEEEVSEDATPDSVFKGNVTDEGELDTHGAGSLHITDIYRIDDHQYAFGKISWPDGISGSIYLVRP